MAACLPAGASRKRTRSELLTDALSKGDLELELSSGSHSDSPLRVHSALLCAASPVLDGLLKDTGAKSVKVGARGCSVGG